MTDRELMQQALEALEGLADTSWTAAFKQREYDSDEPNENVERERVLGVIAALRERLAQPETGREWVGLTEEEIRNLWDGHVVPVFGKNGINPIVFARAIEAKLKEMSGVHPMTRDDIIQWTREAGGFAATPEFLERFAALVAAAEREACARVVASIAGDDQYRWAADAIRARGD